MSQQDESANPRIDDFHLPGAPDAFQRLWTPHRLAYVSDHRQVTVENECPFCSAPARDDETSLIVARGKTCYVVANLYPYNAGHLLICPYRHVPNYVDLTVEETAEFSRMTQIAIIALQDVSHANGFNLGMNQGVAGGAGIAAHLHQHVVPRWTGDVNFMPIIAETKNMSRVLGEVRSIIADRWSVAEKKLDQAQTNAQ